MNKSTTYKEMSLTVVSALWAETEGVLPYSILSPKGPVTEAMKNPDQVSQWLHLRGLSISGSVPPVADRSRRMQVLGTFTSISYDRSAHLPMKGTAFPRWDDGEYTLAVYTDKQGDVVEHYANSNDPSRMVFDKAIGELITLDPLGKNWDGVWHRKD